MYEFDIISGCFPDDQNGDRFLFYDPEKQNLNAMSQLLYMLSKTRRIFKWSGLPDTVKERNLELILQTKGCACWDDITKEEYEVPGLHVFFGARGGKPDIDLMPTDFIIANPALRGGSKVLRIGKDCVVMPNDSMYQGLLPMLSKYCFALAQNELTMSVVNTMARTALIFSADDDEQKENIDNFIADLKEGKYSSILSDKIMGMENMGVQPGATASAAVLTNLIEVEQYWKASMYNDLGLNANWNAKRESLSSSESLLNTDTLKPFITDMLKCRQDFAEEVNKMFGTNISVELDSAWEDNEEELEMIQENGDVETVKEDKQEVIEDEQKTEDKDA